MTKIMRKNDKIRRMALYARVSSDQQAGRETPIAGQIEDLREEADRQGWEVVETYIDAGKSGRTDKRVSEKRGRFTLGEVSITAGTLRADMFSDVSGGAGDDPAYSISSL